METDIDQMKIATLQQRAKAFDSPVLRNNTYPVNPKFFWVTQTCDLIHPTKMKTQHLFNALKMIWNNTMPEKYRIYPMRQWGGVQKWPRGYKKESIENLLAELMNRPDRTKGMDEALMTMAEHLRKVGAKLLEDLK